MSLNTKILLIIGAVFVCALVLIYAVTQIIFIQGLKGIEEQNTNVEIEQAVSLLADFINDLDNDTADWAARDDTYEFIQDHNQEYIQSNLADETFNTLGLNTVLYIDHSGYIVYSKGYDLENKEEIPVATDLLNHFSEHSLLLSGSDQNQGLSGILELNQGLTIVAAQPILNSKNEEPALGTLVFVRLLNEDTKQELSMLDLQI